MWVGLTVSVCLYCQEVEEDPQGAGKSPEMWLTALAANPVHLLSKHSVLEGTHVSLNAQVDKRRGGKGTTREASRSTWHHGRGGSLLSLSPQTGASAIPTHQKTSRSEKPWHRPSSVEVPGSLIPDKPTWVCNSNGYCFCREQKE